MRFTYALTITLAGRASATLETIPPGPSIFRRPLSPRPRDPGQMESLRSLIEDKARIAQTGEPFPAMDVARMAVQLVRYRTWVERILRS